MQLNIGTPEYKTVTHFQDGANGDIISILEKNYPSALNQVSEIAKEFKGETLKDSAFKVWSYLKDNIQYKADGSIHQKILLPKRLVADKIGDCKSYSLFAASMLGAMGYRVGFCYASYSSNPTPSHVYVIAEDKKGNRVLVDGVWHSFNSEKSFNHKKIHWMRISTLSGVGELNDLPTEKIIERIKVWRGRIDNYAPGSSERQQIRKRLSDLVAIYKDRTGTEIGKTKGKGKVGKGIKKVALSPGRNAFLTLIKLNARGVATRIANALIKNPSGVENMWVKKLGGNISALKKAVEKGKDKKPFLGAKTVKGIEGPELVALALPVIAAVGKFLKGIKGDVGDAAGSLESDGVEAGGDASVDLDSPETEVSDKGKGADHDGSGFSLSPKVMLIGGVLLAGIFVVPKLMKK